MKKTINKKKLQLPTETVRLLQREDLEDVAGGRTNTCQCPSCGNAHSTCPV